MMPAATAGQVLMLTPIGGFVLSTLIFGGAVTADVLLSVALMAFIYLTITAEKNHISVKELSHDRGVQPYRFNLY